MYIHGYFYNQQNDKITVYILTRNDRTVEVEIGATGSGMAFTDDPVEITSQVNDTFDHLLCQQASIRLLTKDFIPDFFCASCHDAVVNIYRGDECLFAGYIEPQTYSQSYNEEFDEIELSCIDMLTALQYAKYRNIGSLGVSYNMVKATAEQRTFFSVFMEIINTIASHIDIAGGHPVRCLYDGSKAIDNILANRYLIFKQTSINELLFLGNEEDNVWQQNEVVGEMLRYLNLHIIQSGFTFYIFSWESVKSTDDIRWSDLVTGEHLHMYRKSIDISIDNVMDADTTISIGEVYNQILLNCKIESVESVIESPLDNDLLVSPYSNKQKYMTEYSSHGEGHLAIKAFDDIVHGNNTDYDGGSVTDWYIQVKNNPQWLFPKNGNGDLMQEYCVDNANQQRLLNLLAVQPAAAIVALGKIEKKTGGKDNAPVPKISMTNYLVVSVNGNEEDNESTVYPNPVSLKAGMPCAIYNGNTTGGVFSPSDDDTINYIVLSGRIMLNPVMKLTDTFKAIYNNEAPQGIYKWWHKTVPSRENEDGRYYTQRFWKADNPGATAVWDQQVEHGFVPFTGTGPELYEFNYSAIGDGSDKISKIAVLACMLVIGDKCVVETGTSGQVGDFEWRTYKPLNECANEDEYYQQSFTIGFDPKLGDKLIGTLFNLQNNISDELGINAEGIAIPVRKKDRIGGRVKFLILGPVNSMWDVITRRHPTFFRSTKWNSSSIPLLAHVSSILMESFEIKVYSNNGLVNNTSDSDIVYISDTKETFVNRKDDVVFKISSALTSMESRKLGVTESIKMSTPLNVTTGEGVLKIYDYSRRIDAKAEQLYVDSYYKEYHTPRIQIVQKFLDVSDGVVDLFAHYRCLTLNKTFFVQSISRSIQAAVAEITLKEIDHD